MVLKWQIVKFQLKETFSISYGNYSFREALIIVLEKNGYKGFGECTAIDYYNINLTEFIKILERIQSFVERSKIIHPIEFYNFLITLQLPSFLRSAIDCAYWDLFGKLEKISFLELNNIEINQLPISSLTISVDTIENQIKRIQNSDWSNFKVKCSQFDADSIDKLLQLDKNIALDANGSFTEEHCKALEEKESISKLLYIEQPLKIGKEFYSNLKSSNFPNWMADEDYQEHVDLEELQSHYRSINVKLVKCGGLTPAIELISKAKTLGFKVMIGCMTESTIGISAGAVLAPLCDFVDLDGANLIANDIAKGTVIENGNIYLSEKNGLGITIS